jgi:RNA polymerase sigma-70 factor (subfamily 1)
MSDGPLDERHGREFRRLLTEAQSGCDWSLAELLAHFRPYLKRLASRMLDPEVRPKEGSSDIVQLTLIEGQRDFAQCKANDPASLRLWLRRILINNVQDVYRHYVETQSRDLTREQRLDDSRSRQMLLKLAIDDADPPSEVAAKAEEAQLVERTIAALKPEYAEAIILRFYDDLRFRQIGQLLGKSPGAAEQLVKRALFKFAMVLRKVASHDEIL